MTEYFPEVKSIKYEGPDSKNPLAFKYYNPQEVVLGKTMAQHLRFSVCYWHTLKNLGTDQFGGNTIIRKYNDSSDPMEIADMTLEAAFELFTKLGVNFWCFHDRDIAPEADDLAETNKRLDKIVQKAKKLQADTGVKLLWGTTNAFSHRRFMAGAGTNPSPEVFAYAASQIKKAVEITNELGGEGYVFWGGREGYMSLLNTDMGRELDHMGQFLGMARDYARSQGFKGNFFIEPKPMEPMKHQYDFDAATAIGFLRQYGLDKDFKMNIEVNHATLAQHTFQHEIETSAKAGMLGSLDANRGDYQNGWDTDQFPNNIQETTEAMLVFFKAGGLQGGGINFDAKIRRNSTDMDDVFHAHIGGADTFARALIIADKIITSSPYEKLRKERYSSFDSGKGKDFEAGKLSLQDLYKIAQENGELQLKSGKQELFENIINQYI